MAASVACRLASGGRPRWVGGSFATRSRCRRPRGRVLLLLRSHDACGTAPLRGGAHPQCAVGPLPSAGRSQRNLRRSACVRPIPSTLHQGRVSSWPRPLPPCSKMLHVQAHSTGFYRLRTIRSSNWPPRFSPVGPCILINPRPITITQPVNLL